MAVGPSDRARRNMVEMKRETKTIFQETELCTDQRL